MLITMFMIHGSILKELVNHPDKPGITQVTGPHRAGKTIMMRQKSDSHALVVSPVIVIQPDYESDSKYEKRQTARKIHLLITEMM